MLSMVLFLLYCPQTVNFPSERQVAEKESEFENLKGSKRGSINLIVFGAI